jgi:predicted DCC family thiol-disulfide oxidoreductase YuxK
MSSMTKKPPGLDVWIDGDCALCRRSEEWCSVRDRNRQLRFIDLHAADSNHPPGSPEAMAAAVHVRLADGTVMTGFDAWRRILFELDGWRWLARATGLPGIRHLGRAVYSMTARSRHRIRVRRN